MAIWELSGRLQVNESLTSSSGSGVIRDLAGVRVVVSGTTTGVWKQWCDIRTASDGKFSCSLDKNTAKRRFKVEVILEDGLLRVMRPKLFKTGRESTKDEPAPIEVVKDGNKREGQQVDFGSIALSDTAAGNVERNHARRAALWYVARTVQNALSGRDAWLGFNQQLTISYPSILNTSAWGNRVHIAADWRGPSTNPSYNIKDIVHEMMHIWNYQHNYGMSANWVVGAFGTHNRQEPANIAFHEGFAEWASFNLQHLLWGRSVRELPYNRCWLANDSDYHIADIHEFEKNDDCVTSALLLLIYPHAERLLFGTRSAAPHASTSNLAYVDAAPAGTISIHTCPVSKLDFWDLLLAFRGGQHPSWPTDWQVGDASFGILRFFNRVADIFPDKFSQASKAVYVSLLDPNASDEIRDHCTLVMMPFRPPKF